jgi:ribonuclease HI
MTKWITGWKANDWLHKVKGQGKQPIKSRDLWEELDQLVEGHEVT